MSSLVRSKIWCGLDPLRGRRYFFKPMRTFLLSFIALLAFPAEAADPPSKRRGGFFGFGSPPAEQISAGLFPETDSDENASSGMSSTSSRQRSTAPPREGIFRSGEPQQVSATSYVIENGRKVERPVAPSPAPVTNPATNPVEKPTEALLSVSTPPPAPILAATVQGDEKKGGFFGFGKKNQEVASSPPASGSVPEAMPILAATPVAAPGKVKPAPVVATKMDASVGTPAATDVEVDTPNFAGVKTEKPKLGWIPFRGRKKNDESVTAPNTPEPLVATSAAPARTASPIEETRATASGPAKPSPEKPAPTEVAAFEIRREDSLPVETEKKEKADREGGFLAPISKIMPPKKELDLTGAETIIANGEIVKDVSSLSSTVSASQGAAPASPRQAPQVVNGVKTYASWDDVGALTNSAADRLIGGIR